MLYGTDTWTMNGQKANKLLTTEMDFWRSSGSKSRKRKIRFLNVIFKTLMDKF